MRVDGRRGIKEREIQEHRVRDRKGGWQFHLPCSEKLDAKDGGTITKTRKAGENPSKSTITRTCFPFPMRFAMIVGVTSSIDAAGVIVHHYVVISLQTFLKCSKQSFQVKKVTQRTEICPNNPDHLSQSCLLAVLARKYWV